LDKLLFLCSDGVHGNYYMVQTNEAGHVKCVYEGDKPSYDVSQFIPVPVSKGYFMHYIRLVYNTNMHGRLSCCWQHTNIYL